MATLHLLHGFTGAGKTTFAKQLANEQHAIRFTTDEWMVTLYGNNPPENLFATYFARVESVIWNITLQLLTRQQDVILDAGFWTRVSRDEARAKAHGVNADVVLYYVCAQEAVMKARVLQRSKALPAGALMIDEAAFALFKTRFEPLGADEAHVLIKTDA